MTAVFCLFSTLSCVEKVAETNGAGGGKSDAQEEQPYIYYYGEDDAPAMCGPAGATEVFLPDGRIIIMDIPTLCSEDPWYHDDDELNSSDQNELDDILLDEKGFIDVTITPY